MTEHVNVDGEAAPPTPAVSGTYTPTRRRALRVRPAGARVRSSPYLVPGTLVVAFLLATGRWGSYLGLPRYYLFLTDISLVTGACWLSVRRRHFRDVDRSALFALLPIAMLFLWSLVRAVAGGVPTVDGLRDLAPYVYALVAGSACWQTDKVARKRTLWFLRVALVLHLAWVTASLFFPTLAVQGPLLGGRVHVFEIRADFDATVLAVTSGLFAVECVRNPRWRTRMVLSVLAGWPAFLILTIANRAGLVALLMAVLVAGLACSNNLRQVPRRYLLGLATIALVILAIAIPQTSAYRRLAGDAAFSGNSTAGTTAARQQAWSDVLEYVDAEPERVVAGVGFGTDFLTASGAAPIFEGTTYKDVRAPHNYLLNTYARLGLIGVGITLWLVLLLVRAGWQALHKQEPSLLLVLYILLFVSLLTSSLVGVILESPFGAIPFFWASGLILVGQSRLHRTPLHQ